MPKTQRHRAVPRLQCVDASILPIMNFPVKDSPANESTATSTRCTSERTKACSYLCLPLPHLASLPRVNIHGRKHTHARQLRHHRHVPLIPPLLSAPPLVLFLLEPLLLLPPPLPPRWLPELDAKGPQPAAPSHVVERRRQARQLAGEQRG